MGFRFRKSIKIAPGVRLNIGKKGISSVSVGGRGARINIGKRGTTASTGLPGTGLSYTQKLSGPAKSRSAKSRSVKADTAHAAPPPVPPSSLSSPDLHSPDALSSTTTSRPPAPRAPRATDTQSTYPDHEYRKVSFGLLLGILFIPYIFSWLVLREGYSTTARVLSMGWLMIVVISWLR
ncbi:DUF4236 domain-containing protein [Psychrobacter sanguinis]|uniref:DUF4236 domain-containing protein n=1 Tax=Psychrobacter sanguinis TaxID=861445 RepID=A0A844M0X4_9GAMM|nr:DUF4236 domain-containing protein [Psychrobacter sanguinis]